MNNVLRVVLVVAGVLFIGVIAVVVAAVVFLSKPGTPELVTLGTFSCAGGETLRLVEKHTVVSRFSLSQVIRHELFAVHGAETVPIELAPTPAHLRMRPELQRFGDGRLFLHFYEPSRDVLACVEENANAIGGLAKTSDVGRGRLVEQDLFGRAYWSAPAASLDLEFRDGKRRMSIHRDGIIAVAEGYTTTFVGHIHESTFECCHDDVPFADLARFTNAEGKTAADVVAGLPVEPFGR